MEMNKLRLTDEMIAAFLEGNATAQETEAILLEARKDSRLREYLSLAAPKERILPMLAQAASGQQDNLCNVRCEQYILQCFGITVSEEALTEEALESDWLKDGGTPLFRMGSLCSLHGLSVARKYHSSLVDIRVALSEGYQVIVAVDGGEIDGDAEAESLEDQFIGKIPDHSLVVLSCEGEVVCYDPFHGDVPQVVPEDKFMDAWNDSDYYMVKINTKDAVAKLYRPAPLDLSDVRLPDSLMELTEAIAENTHEIWSRNRLNEGWSYGTERDDAQLKHPDLLPYSDLTEGEKEYDRATAINAIKLIVKLGYKIEKR